MVSTTFTHSGPAHGLLIHPDMAGLENPGRILVVDDNEQLLSGISRNLRRVIPVVTANSGGEALALLRTDRQFSIIISDMRMPGMDGAQFFAEARFLVPDAVRILLTGQADMPSVIAAINEGRIYRFLSKPVDFEDLRNIVGAAMAHFRLQQEERREKLAAQRQQVDRLEDLLALSSTVAWGQAARSRHLAALLGEHLGLGDVVSLELAAVLHAARLAFPASTPPEAVKRAIASLAHPLDAEDPVRVMLTELSGPRGQPLRVGSRLVQVAIDAGEATGSWHDRVEFLVQEKNLDGRLSEALRAIHERLTPTPPRLVEAAELTLGMRLVEPLCDDTGVEVAPAGARVSPVVLALIANRPAPLRAVNVVADEVTGAGERAVG